MKKYLYGNKSTDATPANGVEGIIIISEGKPYFRVYHKDGEFVDYLICHSDMKVTIDETELAYFYRRGDMNTLDHTPQCLDLIELS